jgi:hypothetical protein
VAFERWWRADAHRPRGAATYVVATVLGGWLHMLSLAFTLTPVSLFRRARAGDRACVDAADRLGLVTAALARRRAAAAARQRLVTCSRQGGQDSVTPNARAHAC